jgi:hypothetical protein
MKDQIQYIASKNINREKWDACIFNASNGIVFAYSWYLDVVCDSWDALIIGDYDVVFPLTKKSKFGLNYLFNPIFALQLGAFSKQEVSSDTLSQLLTAIPSKIKLIDLNLNFGNRYQGNDFETTEKTCQQIDLSASYEAISKKYSSNIKRNLAKAKKNKLEIVLSVDVDQVVSLFRENRGETLKEMKEEQYVRLNSLISTMRQNKTAKIYECWIGKELIASACFSVCNNRIVYIKGASNSKGRDLGAMHMIMDEVIHLNSGNNLFFDFGGSSIPQVARFNRSFGAVDYSYQRLYRNKLPLLIRLVKK